MKLRMWFLLFVSWLAVAAVATYVGIKNNIAAMQFKVVVVPLWIEDVLRGLVCGGVIGVVGSIAAIKGKEEK